MTLDDAVEALKTAYAALDGDSNDAEHEALWEITELLEEEVKSLGGELPEREEEW